MYKLLVYIGILACVPFGHCANILGIWYHGGRSHHILGEALLKELARRGHNVTMVSPFPLKTPFSNYTDIHLTGILEDQIARSDRFMQMNRGNALTGLTSVFNLIHSQMEMTLNHTEMRKLLASDITFDVILMDWFGNAPLLVYGSLLDAPVILVCSHSTSYDAASAVGSPLPPSYVPHILFDFPGEMSFLQRVANSLVTLLFGLLYVPMRREYEGLVRKYHGERYTLDDLMDNIAVVLTNGHYAYESPRPSVPNLVPVGGFHVQKAGKLPKHLQSYMDNSKNGVIYFSLGSNMKSIFLPEEKRGTILKVFSKLPYDILWKWEESAMSGKPDNVRLGKWFPQNEILAHPKTKLFISHGGLLSTIEALHHGVPVLGIPIFGDQRLNIRTATRNGYALLLELADLTDETFENTIKEIMHNPRYKANAQKRSSLLRDQPVSPMDKAVFWVEHVIRHKGAPHLKNAGVKLYWYQYILLDVAAFILFLVFLVLLLFYFIIKLTLFLCRKRQSRKESDKKTN